jgi:hypothetical protein
MSTHLQSTYSENTSFGEILTETVVLRARASRQSEKNYTAF